MRQERARPSRHASVTKAMDYMLKRWNSFDRFLADETIYLTNNAAGRSLDGLCLGRKFWLFTGSDCGADRAAFMFTLIGVAKLNDTDPQGWLPCTCARIADTSQSQLNELVPWNWAVGTNAINQTAA